MKLWVLRHICRALLLILLSSLLNVGWVRTSLWTRTLVYIDVQSARWISHLVMAYQLTPGRSSHLLQNHGKVPFCAQTVEKRKMRWKVRLGPDPRQLYNLVLYNILIFFSLPVWAWLIFLQEMVIFIGVWKKLNRNRVGRFWDLASSC